MGVNMLRVNLLSIYLCCCFFVFFMFSNKDVIVDKNSNNLEFLLSFSVTAAQHKQNAKRKAWLEMLHSKIPPSNCLFKKTWLF